MNLALPASHADELEPVDRPSDRLLGERYQIRELLGRGGMGEVFHAFDLKLRVDVALKAVRVGRAEGERGHELLRGEVRAAREVVSPNVCRIFDLVVEEGQELVSMEFVDGATLAEQLRDRGPLRLQEAREIASQFLAGLEAIHRAGLVHRDFKPENVMITRSGRVVVMDFGLAKMAAEERTGTISGTPAYMAPEQARGEGVDARADVFAAGVVLAEMLTVGGKGNLEARQALWRLVRETPPRVPECPWAPVLLRALAPNAQERYPSAHALARALEEVTLRLPGFESKRPYPGLVAFTENDAEYFFGREVEVEAVWKKLKRPRLLAVIGPSGAGKSSFLRAGLLPTLPGAWRAIFTTPGTRPFQSLAEALAPAFAGDAEPARFLLRLEEEDTAVSLLHRFRQGREEALLVVDQFEELFTLNPPEVQQAFAQLLGRLVLEADVHVIIALRDDFLFRCHAYEALGPAFSDLIPLGEMSETALRRALVQPALACSYRFEDDAMVDEMVTEVSRERGALPLLAFAASRLWEMRDQERGLLTREAYRAIGGVTGALAQHAEATLERIGEAKGPVVRELFRNLVTAQGTRTVRERRDLLSVFERSEAPQRGEAEAVLNALVDARLLTSYERPGEEGGESRHQVEIIHESLLGAWPRLVRWQTQDADGEQLRDQLRQAAQLWQDRGRPEDLLWSGTAYRDLALWRERYPGGLTGNEDAFAEAAMRLAGRRRRRRRIAVAALLVAIGAVAVTTSVLWRRSEVSRQEAEAEVRQREAAELLALGRLRLEDYPSAALAHAIASLERADNEPARRFAVEVLWRGPSALVLADQVLPEFVEWSPDGRWLALGGAGLLLLERDSGKRRQLASTVEYPIGFTADAKRLVTSQEGMPPTIHIWSLPGAELLETWKLPYPATAFLLDRQLLTVAFDGRGRPGDQTALVRMRSLDGGAERTLGQWQPRGLSDWDVDPSGEWLYSVQGGRLLRERLDATGEAPPRILGRHGGEVSVWVRPWRDRVTTGDAKGEVRLWSASTGRLERTLRSPADARRLALDPLGRFLATAPDGPLSARSFFLFDLKAPREAEPVPLDLELSVIGRMAFHPQGQWLASCHGDLVLWNLAGKRSTVLSGQKSTGNYGITVAFTPEGRLVSTSGEGVRLWPSFSETDEEGRELWSRRNGPLRPLDYLTRDPHGRFAIVVERIRGRLIVMPLDGSPPATHALAQAQGQGMPVIATMTLDSAGRQVALGSFEPGHPEAGSMRILDLSTGAERTLHAPPTSNGECKERLAAFGAVEGPLWLPDGRLVSDGYTGLRLWDLSTGSSRWLRPCRAAISESMALRATPDSRAVVSLHGVTGAGKTSDLSIFDLVAGTFREVTSHGKRLASFALDATGSTLVTGGADGLVRVGPFSGGEPHLLYGHTRAVTGLAVSPDGKWIASGSYDGRIRLWPMPAGRPLHTLPYEELLAKLRSLTNLRVVPDPGSATGYKLEPGPFPGWANVPDW